VVTAIDQSEPSAQAPGQRLLELLACPECQQPLTLDQPTQLCCNRCGRTFPIRSGVPRLLSHVLPESVAITAAAFGWQWQKFRQQHLAFREQMLEWLSPVEPGDFQGRRVLDAGCGSGRHLLLASAFEPDQLVGLDISAAIDVAQEQTRHLPLVDLVQGNLLTPPFCAESFDLVYSIGVVHHVPDPAEAIQALARCLKPGGTLHIWVYAHEGNALVRRVVDPLRRVLARRAPRPAVRLGIVPLVLLLTLATRLAPFRRTLPYCEYLRRMATYSPRHLWEICYDQLMAPTTNYLGYDELVLWFEQAGLVDVRVRKSRGMSWAATGRRRSVEPSHREASPKSA
jgi:SAM-dependent methyltransferase